MTGANYQQIKQTGRNAIDFGWDDDKGCGYGLYDTAPLRENDRTVGTLFTIDPDQLGPLLNAMPDGADIDVSEQYDEYSHDEQSDYYLDVEIKF